MNRAARGAVRADFVGVGSATARVAGEQTGSRIQRLLVPGDDLTEALLVHEPLSLQLSKDLTPRLPTPSLRGDLLQGERTDRNGRPVRGVSSALGVVEGGRHLLVAERQPVERALRGRRDGGLGLRLGLRAGRREDRDEAHADETADQVFSSHSAFPYGSAAAMPGRTPAKPQNMSYFLEHDGWRRGTLVSA